MAATASLYVHDLLGGVVRQKPSVIPDHYTLNNKVVEALRSPDFMTEGGTVEFYCQHPYAHTNDNHRKSLPYALKGVDAVVYSIFYHMGLEVKVRPVMKDLPTMII